MVKKTYFATKRGSAQDMRKGNDANVIFGVEVSLLLRSSYSTSLIY